MSKDERDPRRHFRDYDPHEPFDGNYDGHDVDDGYPQPTPIRDWLIVGTLMVIVIAACWWLVSKII